MTTAENYVYSFEAALDNAKEAHTIHDLLESIDIKWTKDDEFRRGFENWLTKKQQEGYDYNKARASLARHCQNSLNPIYNAFEDVAFCVCQNDDEPWRQDIGIAIKGAGRDVFSYQQRVEKTPDVAFPHIFRNALDAYGLKKELGQVRVNDGKCSRVANSENFLSLLHFYDSENNIGWWTAGVADQPIRAVYKASVDGFRFALDPRRDQCLPQPIQRPRESQEHAPKRPHYNGHGDTPEARAWYTAYTLD